MIQIICYYQLWLYYYYIIAIIKLFVYKVYFKIFWHSRNNFTSLIELFSQKSLVFLFLKTPLKPYCMTQIKRSNFFLLPWKNFYLCNCTIRIDHVMSETIIQLRNHHNISIFLTPEEIWNNLTLSNRRAPRGQYCTQTLWPKIRAHIDLIFSWWTRLKYVLHYWKHAKVIIILDVHSPINDISN